MKKEEILSIYGNLSQITFTYKYAKGDIAVFLSLTGSVKKH